MLNPFCNITAALPIPPIINIKYSNYVVFVFIILIIILLITIFTIIIIIIVAYLNKQDNMTNN